MPLHSTCLGYPCWAHPYTRHLQEWNTSLPFQISCPEHLEPLLDASRSNLTESNSDTQESKLILDG